MLIVFIIDIVNVAEVDTVYYYYPVGLQPDEASNVVKRLNFSPSCQQMVTNDNIVAHLIIIITSG